MITLAEEKDIQITVDSLKIYKDFDYVPKIAAKKMRRKLHNSERTRKQHTLTHWTKPRPMVPNRNSKQETVLFSKHSVADGISEPAFGHPSFI